MKLRNNDTRSIHKTHTPNAENTHSKFMRKNILKKPYATHAQSTHDKCRNARSKFIKTPWKHTNTIHKPYTQHARKTHARNAETHRTDSQKAMKTHQKYTSTQQVHNKKGIGNIHKWCANHTQITHTTHKTTVEQHAARSLKR